MKLLLPTALLFGFSAPAQLLGQGAQHSTGVPKSPSYQLVQVAHSQNVVLTMAQYTGVLLNDPGHQPRPYGLTARTLSPTEVVEAERILARCSQQGRVSWYRYKVKYVKDSYLQSAPDAIHPLPFYKRQYKGLNTGDGQRVVWINAFPKADSFPYDWKVMEVEVQDGGKAYFNIYVNLDTKQCFNFLRNSIGG